MCRRCPTDRCRGQRRTQATSQHYAGLLQVIDATDRTISEKRWFYDRLGAHGNSRVVIRFKAPAEVNGWRCSSRTIPTSLRINGWTPAINQSRTPDCPAGSPHAFFGTDFSFEDLEERDVDHNEYKLLGDETLAASRAGRSKAARARDAGRGIRNRSCGFARVVIRTPGSRISRAPD